MKISLVISALACGLVGTAAGVALPSELTSPIKNLSFMRAKATRQPAKLETTGSYQSMSRIKGFPTGRSAVEAFHLAMNKVPGSAYQNVTAAALSTQYSISALWDDQPIELLFDTGSSDTWAVKTGYACQGDWGMPTNESVCGWGPTTIDEFRYGETPELHLAIGYGSGELVRGPMGRSDITVAGIEVTQVNCALANETLWHGNNVTSGMLGLAYPALTSAYLGEHGGEKIGFRQQYENFFSRMVSEGLVDSVFSVAIDKGTGDGVIAWGGLPPEQMYDNSTIASTPIIVAKLIGDEGEGDVTAFQHSFYTIVVDGMAWGHTREMTPYTYIVDTGTTNMYLPPPLAASIAGAFSPPATYLYEYSAYFTDCEAIAPELSVVIDGVDFTIVPDHLIFREIKDPRSNLCLLGVTTGGFGPYILGDVFLQNVLAVFDVGGAQMTFYGRN